MIYHEDSYGEAQTQHNPSVVERMRRAINSPLRRAAVGAGALALAAGSAFGISQLGGPSNSHESKPLPAATANQHPHAHKEIVPALAKEHERLQEASLVAAQTILKDIEKDLITNGYKGTYVGDFPGQAQNPEMYSGWNLETDTMDVSSITQPYGSGLKKFNYVDIALKVKGNNAATINQAAQHRQLTVGDFEAALSNSRNVEFVSAEVKTPHSGDGTVITVNNSGVMSESQPASYGSTTITNANAQNVVEPFLSELQTTTNALQTAFHTYQQ